MPRLGQFSVFIHTAVQATGAPLPEYSPVVDDSVEASKTVTVYIPSETNVRFIVKAANLSYETSSDSSIAIHTFVDGVLHNRSHLPLLEHVTIEGRAVTTEGRKIQPFFFSSPQELEDIARLRRVAHPHADPDARDRRQRDLDGDAHMLDVSEGLQDLSAFGTIRVEFYRIMVTKTVDGAPCMEVDEDSRIVPKLVQSASQISHLTKLGDIVNRASVPAKSIYFENLDDSPMLAVTFEYRSMETLKSLGLTSVVCDPQWDVLSKQAAPKDTADAAASPKKHRLGLGSPSFLRTKDSSIRKDKSKLRTLSALQSVLPGKSKPPVTSSSEQSSPAPTPAGGRPPGGLFNRFSRLVRVNEEEDDDLLSTAAEGLSINKGSHTLFGSSAKRVALLMEPTEYDSEDSVVVRRIVPPPAEDPTAAQVESDASVTE